MIGSDENAALLAKLDDAALDAEFAAWADACADELADKSALERVRFAWRAGYLRAAWHFRPASERDRREREELRAAIELLKREGAK